VVLLLAALLEFLGVFFGGGLAAVLSVVGLVLNVSIAAVGIAIAARPSRWHFRLIILAAIVDVVVLAFAGQRLLWS
jgi:hypothetical protein